MEKHNAMRKSSSVTKLLAARTKSAWALWALCASMASMSAAAAVGCSGKGGDDTNAAASTSGACADTQDYFDASVWQTTLSTTCITCHVAGGAAGTTRMVLDKDPSALAKNFATVKAIASLADDSGQLLVDKPTGKISHGGGAVLAAGSAGALALSSFSDKVHGNCAGSVTPAALLGRQIRRLTRDEYANTLHDLVGVVGSDYADKLPADAILNGFDNNAGALTVSTLYADKARTNAEDIAKAVDLKTVASCTPAAGQEVTCATTVVRDFGERAFRRPVTDAEVSRYVGLYSLVAANEGFEGGIRAVVSAALSSPNFLYRTELGETKDGWDVLTGWEVASELSYFFTRSMPDAELLRAARAGELSDKANVAKQATRLIALPQSRQSFSRFVSQWLDLDKIGQAVKDEKTYPNFDASLRSDLVDETVSLYDRVARGDGGSFRDLFTANTTSVSARVAAFYGIPAPQAGQLVPTADGRIGILTHASILATQATPSSASPVRRGKLIREKFFCTTLAPPPPGVAAQLPPVDPNLPNRARFTQHSQDPACASCHKLMDPIGFGFEGFDGAGHAVSGADVSGEILSTASTDGTFNGVVDLEGKLASSADVQSCFARQYLRYAFGINDDGAALEAAQRVAATFSGGGAGAGDGAKLKTLLLAFTQEDHFFHRHTDTDLVASAPDTTTPTPAPSGTSTTPPAPDAGTGTGTGTSTVTAPTANDPSLAVTVANQDQGNGAYQKDVTIVNNGQSTVTWTVTIAAAGSIFNNWNADYTTQNGNFVFVGKDYDKTIGPGQTVTFGFQAK